MKRFLTLPKDDKFYQTYAKFSLGIGLGVVVAQLISTLTESGIIYFAVYESALIFGEYYAKIAGYIGVILGVLMIEIVGLRFFLPKAVDSFLYGRWNGLHAWMSAFSVVMAVLLITGSAFLSYKGKSIVIEGVLNESQQLEQTAIDSTFNDSKKTATATFKSDSTATAQNYQSLTNKEIQKFDNQIEVAKNNLNHWKSKSSVTGKNYSTRINNAQTKIKQIKANKSAAIAALERERINKIDALKIATISKSDSLQTAYTTASTNSKSDFQHKTATYDNGGTWIVLIAIVFAVIGIILQRIFYKGSGIEEKHIITDYHFRPSVITELKEAITERLQQVSHQAINNFAAKTAAPPTPALPHALLDVSNYSQPAYHWDNVPTIAANSDTSDNQLESRITAYAESIITLEEKNLHEQAETIELKANEVIKAYLERNAGTATVKAIDAFRTKVINYVNDNSKQNPFDVERRQIGFSQISNGQRNNGERRERNCKHCNQSFQHKHWNKQYCSDECRVKAWEQRTGRKLQKGKRSKYNS